MPTAPKIHNIIFVEINLLGDIRLFHEIDAGPVGHNAVDLCKDTFINQVKNQRYIDINDNVIINTAHIIYLKFQVEQKSE